MNNHNILEAYKAGYNHSTINLLSKLFYSISQSPAKEKNELMNWFKNILDDCKELPEISYTEVNKIIEKHHKNYDVLEPESELFLYANFD